LDRQSLDNGRYELREEIGHGAMGVVHLAWDRRLQRLVAIKVLHPGAVTDDLARAAFVQEARIHAMLDQTRIARIHDFFFEAGRDFIVMEYVPGETLSEILKRGPMPEREVVRLGAQLAEGLLAAHKKGVVHRDLKPSNLRINEDGDLKILDFGVAKLWRQAPNSEAAPRGPLHRDGTTVHDSSGFVGTYPYFSPEQLRGHGLDERSDLYAAAAVLYEAATGRQVFADIPDARLAEVIESEMPVPPRLLVRGISRSLQRVVLRALAKEKGRRFANAAELRQALLWTRWRRWSGWASATAAVLALGVAFAADVGQLRSRVLPAPKPGAVRVLAVLPFQNGTGDASLDNVCRAFTREFILASTQALDVATLAPTTASALQGYSARRVGREFDAGAVIAGRLVRRDNRLELEATVYADPAIAWRPMRRIRVQLDSLQIFSAAGRLLQTCAKDLAITPRLGSQGDLDRLRKFDSRAIDAYIQGRARLESRDPVGRAGAVDCLTRAVEIDSNFAFAWSALARATYAAPTDQLPLRDAAQRAERAAWRALAIDPDLPDPYLVLAGLDEFQRHDSEAARREIERALTLDPNGAFVHQVAGLIHVRSSRFDNAQLELRRAWELDPLSEPYRHRLWSLLARSEFDSVIVQGLRLRSEHPVDWQVDLLIGQASGRKGEPKQAVLYNEDAHQQVIFTIPRSLMAGAQGLLRAPSAVPLRRPQPGTVYVGDLAAADGTGAIFGLDPETGAQWLVASGPELSNPTDLMVESDGSLLVMWERSRRLMRLNPANGQQQVVSAAGQFVEPSGIAVSNAGELYVADWHMWPPGFVHRVDQRTGGLTTIVSAERFQNPAFLVCLPDGDLAVAANVSPTGGGCVYRAKLNGEFSVLASGGLLASPLGIELGADGALYVCDYSAFGGTGGVIRVDPASGAQSAVARGGEFLDPVGLTFLPSGELLVTDWTMSRPQGKIVRLDPEDGKQTRVYAGGLFAQPSGIAIIPGCTQSSRGQDLVVEGPMQLLGGDFASIRIEPGAELTVTGLVRVRGDVRVRRGATLVCDGWIVARGNLVVEESGRIVHTPRTATGLGLEVGGVLDVQAGAAIEVSGCGLRGGRAERNSCGETYDEAERIMVEPGEIFAAGPGASHGGEGGRDTVGGVARPVNDSEANPHLLGTGGGGARGGAGGGRITIRAHHCHLNGWIRANGGSGEIYRDEIGGGGAGGSIRVIALELDGTGWIEARGGFARRGTGSGGGGGGGRVAIYTNGCELPRDHVNVAGGQAGFSGHPGTIHYGSRSSAPRLTP